MGRPVPPAIANAPELLPGLQLYLVAFCDLETERPIGQFIPGPIPRSHVRAYARQLGLVGDDRAYFAEVIAALDDWHLKTMDERRKRDSPKPPQPKKWPGGGVRRTRR
jgi:hypothetical protein